MREIYGDLWAYEGRKGFKICVTTNGFVKKDGTGVCGAGVAQQASGRYPEFPRLLGQSLQTRGNVVSLILPQILSFPVKHNWYEDADIPLIAKSAKELAERARKKPDIRFILPRPGCGNGHLPWLLVRKTLMKYLADLDNVWIIEKWEKKNDDAKEVHREKAAGNGSKSRNVKHASHDA